jgi:hypothetical protein
MCNTVKYLAQCFVLVSAACAGPGLEQLVHAFGFCEAAFTAGGPPAVIRGL